MITKEELKELGFYELPSGLMKLRVDPFKLIAEHGIMEFELGTSEGRLSKRLKISDIVELKTLIKILSVNHPHEG